MRVLITGATGLVGTHLARLLRQKNIQINYLTTSKDKIEKSPEYRGFFWDPSEGEIDEACLEGVDAIIHLAGASIAKKWTSEYKKEIIESRTKTAQLLYKTLQDSPYEVSRFISSSAIGIYPSSLEKLYHEDENAVDDSFLGEVVERWEAAAWEFESLDLEVAIVRTGLVLAEDGGALPKMKEPVDLNVGAAFGTGKQWQSWIHIEDLAGIYAYILEMELKGIYNAVAPNPVTNKELIKHIASQLDKSVWLPIVPAVALKLALGEMATVLLSSQLVSSEKIQNAGYKFRYKNLAKALESLL
ncbi:TIGR01777 family protein [Antarcticibacterium arcticum]|uniref:TIGR01777 family protein n=1 Tax=Antarcticibacterium arcticum TaxID=2585771 RepID=A0A5B8YKS9_9FLAO|nr:TIGR01777 family oxidoreductase [Antarcticibacterium arcticum]QED37818.1 TIGR01777 family protein [Antarcticibacterium arcticum]